MAEVLLGLGSNSDDQQEMLQKARILINIFMGPIINSSALYKTEPWGYADQNEFVNQVVKIKTSQPAEKLHDSLLKVEAIMVKRKASTKYGPRNIDIDILLYDDLIIDTKDLKIPHPRMHERNFVLIPLTEIAPEFIHPVIGKTSKALLVDCIDKGKVILCESEE